VRHVPLILLFGLAGCLSSTWDLPDVGGPGAGYVDRAYYPDADGDGWGDDLELTMMSRADDTEGMVRNNRDCDDGDATVTGFIGALCPDTLVLDDEPTEVVGILTSDRDFVAVHPSAPVEHPVPAEVACRWWGLVGHLATFSDMAEFGLVRDRLDEAADGEPYAVWIGLASDGEQWGWTDDTDPGVIDAIGWCDAVPPNAAWHDRAALVKRSDGWCLGLPPQSGGAQYSNYTGHFVCERPAPDPDEYKIWLAETD